MLASCDVEIGEETRADREARRKERRNSLALLAEAVRRIAEATVTTNVEPKEIDRISEAVHRLAGDLERSSHPGPFSGLLGPDDIDPTRPGKTVPLSPWCGPFNPQAPPLTLRFENGEVHGRVELGKRYIGPPATAHGGVVAGIMDQVLASAGYASGEAGVTATMEVRFRRPTPLFRELTLHGWAEARSVDESKRIVHARILSGEEVTAEARAVVVRSKFKRHRPGKIPPDTPPTK